MRRSASRTGSQDRPPRQVPAISVRFRAHRNENRIDELYSVVQYLDLEILGPPVRFNRDFYQLDERGRPVDYHNLAELRGRLRPALLRRRKTDVDTQLPGRTVKNYFVPGGRGERATKTTTFQPRS
jgi:SNF2 family DNA or RNA helicase